MVALSVVWIALSVVTALLGTRLLPGYAALMFAFVLVGLVIGFAPPAPVLPVAPAPTPAEPLPQGLTVPTAPAPLLGV